MISTPRNLKEKIIDIKEKMANACTEEDWVLYSSLYTEYDDLVRELNYLVRPDKYRKI